MSDSKKYSAFEKAEAIIEMGADQVHVDLLKDILKEYGKVVAEVIVLRMENKRLKEINKTMRKIIGPVDA